MARAVELKVYDLSGGLAASLSFSLLGKKIDGIWHTGVVVAGEEYFFGQGIQHCPSSASPFGQPVQTIPMGTTEVPDDMIQDFLIDSATNFNAMTYDLLKNNCNNFSNHLCEFLVGKSIPDHITGLPADVLNSPMGPMLVSMLQPALQNSLGNATATGIAVPSSAPASTNTSSAAPAGTSRGMTNVKPEIKPYKAALRAEFDSLMAAGDKHPDQAAKEALIVVTAAVEAGIVAPPAS